MNLLVHLLRFVCRLTVFLLCLLLVLPLVIIGIIVAKICHFPALNQWVLSRWSLLILHVCGLKVSIHGQLPKHPIFILANHVSWLDIPIIHSLALVGLVGKHEIKYWPILGWLAMLGDTVFIQRGNQDSRKMVVKDLVNRLEKGRSVAVFPEGKVTDGSYLGRFHRQLVQAAVMTQTPVVPVAIKFITQAGDRNTEVCFKNNEWFIVHVWRILTLPSSFVEIHCGPGLTNVDNNARIVTAQAHQFVDQKLSENDYLPAAHST